MVLHCLYFILFSSSTQVLRRNERMWKYGDPACLKITCIVRRCILAQNDLRGWTIPLWLLVSNQSQTSHSHHHLHQLLISGITYIIYNKLRWEVRVPFQWEPLLKRQYFIAANFDINSSKFLVDCSALLIKPNATRSMHLLVRSIGRGTRSNNGYHFIIIVTRSLWIRIICRRYDAPVTERCPEIGIDFGVPKDCS